MTQPHREDVIIHEGCHALRITPDAGSVKNHQARFVPIHPRLIELGFLAFVSGAKDGPLFYSPETRRKKDAATSQAQLTAGDVAGWARLNGLGDPDLIRPLHTLRHRFTMLARRVGIEEQYVDEIRGHAPGPHWPSVRPLPDPGVDA